MDGGHDVSGFISGEFRQWRTLFIRILRRSSGCRTFWDSYSWRSFQASLRWTIDVKRLVSGPRSALASTHRSVLADPNDNGRAADKRCWVVELNSAGDVGCSSVPQAVKSGKAAVYVYRSPPPKSTRAERWFISSFTELLEWKCNRH